MPAVEEWRPVVGFEGRYSVSNFGRVYSHLRDKVLKPQRNTNGRLQVRLCNNDYGTLLQVHVLVLTAFVGPKPAGKEALHFDDDPENNHLDNLRWGTRSENRYDRVRNGRDHNAVKTHCLRGHSLVDPNLWRSPSRSPRDRACFSCSIGRNYFQRGHCPDHQAATDFVYEIVMAEGFEHGTTPWSRLFKSHFNTLRRDS